MLVILIVSLQQFKLLFLFFYFDRIKNFTKHYFALQRTCYPYTISAIVKSQTKHKLAIS